jgi:Zn-dependent peptidase ImmA (M78 family)
MLELTTSYTFTQIPYITYAALDEYATNVVRDFCPELLESPVPLDVDRFLEYYLGLTVDVRRISHNRQILGLTAFNDGTVEIMDEETGLTENLPVKAGTVIIDSSLESKRNEPRRRFTMTHEGAHWLTHRRAFAEDNPFGPAGIYENQFLAAKEGRIDYSRSMKERNDLERMERQADFLSSAILMPIPALRIAFCDYFKLSGENRHRIIRGTSPSEDCHAKQLTEYVAGIFNVSKRAALIRLEKLTAIVDRGQGYN